MDLISEIEQSITTRMEDCFEDSNSRDDLRVTIRIATDFHDFLVTFGDSPPLEEVDYIVGTIRSGMDWFFGLMQLWRIIERDKAIAKVEPRVFSHFPALREEFLRVFQRISQPSEIPVLDLLSDLLFLTNLELAFLAQHFLWLAES